MAISLLTISRPLNWRQWHEHDANKTAAAMMEENDDNILKRGTSHVQRTGGERDNNVKNNKNVLVLAKEAATTLIMGGEHGGINPGSDGVVVDGTAFKAVMVGVVVGEVGDRTMRRGAPWTIVTAGFVDGIHGQDVGWEVDH